MPERRLWIKCLIFIIVFFKKHHGRLQRRSFILKLTGANEGFSTYLSLNLGRLLLRLLELVAQGEDLADASVPAGGSHGLPVKGNILLDGGVHQAAVFRLGHGHVALRHDLVWTSLRLLLGLRGVLAILLLQRQVDAGAGRQQQRWWLPPDPSVWRLQKCPTKKRNPWSKGWWWLQAPLPVIISRLICILHPVLSHLIWPELSLRWHKRLTAVFICSCCTLTARPTRLKKNKTTLFSLSANLFFSDAFSP